MHDLVIIGAGPAGMAAAVQGRRLGLDVALVDEQAAPGGQIHRAVEAAESQGRAAGLGPEYRRGLKLAAALRRSGAVYLPGQQVWQVERDGRVFLTDGVQTRLLEGRRLLIAVGAMERPVPVPGWTLPGVMTVGAAQIVHKTTGRLPAEGVWIAGSGPLVLHYAAEVLTAGGRIAGLLDTTPATLLSTARAHPGALWRGWRYALKGMSYMARLRLAGLRHVRAVERVEAVGAERVERVRWRSGGAWHDAPASGLLLHEGVVPHTHMTHSLGCAHDWSETQQCFHPRRDSYGATDVETVFVAGDCGGIGGARVAESQGALAALGAACSLGRIDARERDRQAAPLRREMAAHEAIRPFLDALYRPPGHLQAPADDVIVCRCEGVTAAQIRQAVALGARGPNQAKAYTRCGMGPCQGRLCGLTVTTLIGQATQAAPGAVGSYRIRPPLKPLSLGELASLADQQGTG